MDHGPKCESYNYKTLRGNTGVNLHDLINDKRKTSTGLHQNLKLVLQLMPSRKWKDKRQNGKQCLKIIYLPEIWIQDM